MARVPFYEGGDIEQLNDNHARWESMGRRELDTAPPTPLAEGIDTTGPELGIHHSALAFDAMAATAEGAHSVINVRLMRGIGNLPPHLVLVQYV